MQAMSMGREGMPRMVVIGRVGYEVLAIFHC